MEGTPDSYSGQENIDDNEFMQCVNLPKDKKQTASSYAVKKYLNIGGAKVGWVKFPAEEEVELDIHYGFTSTTTQTTTAMQEYVLNYELGLSVGFAGIGLDEKLSQTYSQSVS